MKYSVFGNDGPWSFIKPPSFARKRRYTLPVTLVTIGTIGLHLGYLSLKPERPSTRDRRGPSPRPTRVCGIVPSDGEDKFLRSEGPSKCVRGLPGSCLWQTDNGNPWARWGETPWVVWGKRREGRCHPKNGATRPLRQVDPADDIPSPETKVAVVGTQTQTWDEGHEVAVRSVSHSYPGRSGPPSDPDVRQESVVSQFSGPETVFLRLSRTCLDTKPGVKRTNLLIQKPNQTTDGLK